MSPRESLTSKNNHVAPVPKRSSFREPRLRSFALHLFTPSPTPATLVDRSTTTAARHNVLLPANPRRAGRDDDDGVKQPVLVLSHSRPRTAGSFILEPTRTGTRPRPSERPTCLHDEHHQRETKAECRSVAQPVTRTSAVQPC
jgi:hypothetical protein